MASSIVNFGWLFYRVITEYAMPWATKTVQLENNCTATNRKINKGMRLLLLIATVQISKYMSIAMQ